MHNDTFRYSRNIHDSVKEEAREVIREMKSASKVIAAKRATELADEDDVNNDNSRWEYRGYGIWEADDVASTRAAEAAENAKNAERMRREQQLLRSSTSPPSAASSATQELDELMNSLEAVRVSKEKNEMNVRQTMQENRTLEDMLGDLETELGPQALPVAGTKRGECAACGQVIAGQVVTALGQTWHPDVRLA